MTFQVGDVLVSTMDQPFIKEGEIVVVRRYLDNSDTLGVQVLGYPKVTIWGPREKYFKKLEKNTEARQSWLQLREGILHEVFGATPLVKTIDEFFCIYKSEIQE